MRLISNAVGIGGGFAVGAAGLVLVAAGVLGGMERFLVAIAIAVAVAGILGSLGLVLALTHDVRWDPVALFRGLAIAIGAAALVGSRGYRCGLECTLPYAAALAPVIALVLVVRALARRTSVKQDCFALALGTIALVAATAQPVDTPCPWHECVPERFSFTLPCACSSEVKELVTR